MGCFDDAVIVLFVPGLNKPRFEYPETGGTFESNRKLKTDENFNGFAPAVPKAPVDHVTVPFEYTPCQSFVASWSMSWKPILCTVMPAGIGTLNVRTCRSEVWLYTAYS